MTPVGMILLTASALATWHLGVEQLDLVLLVIGVVGMAVVALSLLTTLATALIFWLSLRRLPHSVGEVRLESGQPLQTGFVVRNLWYLPFIVVRWWWREPLAEVEPMKRRGELVERIVARRRALTDRVVRRFEVGDVFGLTRVWFDITEKRQIHIVPSVGRLEKMNVVRSMASGDAFSHPEGPPDGERVDIRNYQSGDPLRYVLWRVFARNRQVVVRTPERAIGPVKQTVVYLIAGKGDEPAAGAARVAIESGRLGDDWVLGADGTPEPARTLDAALAAISRSASVPEEERGAGLAPFLRESIPGMKRAHALIFVSAIPGQWLERLERALTASSMRGSIEVIVCCDGIVESGAISRVWRALSLPKIPLDPSALHPASRGELREVLGRLVVTRCSVLLLDRQTGRVYSGGALSRILGREQTSRQLSTGSGAEVESL